MAKSCITCDGKHITEVLNENRTYYYCTDCQKLYERALDSRFGRDVISNQPKHRSVGALIRQGETFLMIKRRVYPFGYAFPAGHIEYQETPLNALEREVFEETGLNVLQSDLLFEGDIEGDKCRYGADIHYYYFYDCTCESGFPFANNESESFIWVTKKEAQKLPLVPVAAFFITKVLTHDRQPQSETR